MKKINVLQVNLRSDFGGGPQHMHQLLCGLSTDIQSYAAMPDDFPYWGKNEIILGKNNCIQVPHRFFSIFTFFSLIRFIKKKQIDIIHSHGKGAGIYSRLAAILTGVYCIHTFHGLHYGKYNSWQRWLYFTLESVLARFTTHSIVVSEGEKREVLKHLNSYGNKLSKIYNGVDVASIYSKKVITDKLNICVIARLDYQKNLELLLIIAKKLKEVLSIPFTIYIIGVEDTDNTLKREIIKQGLNSIVLCGTTTNISPWFKLCHICISTSRWEGFPISLLEAAAHGLPVIATNVIGNQEAVKSGFSGYLYDSTDPTLAVEYICMLAQNKSLYETFSKQSYDWSKNFNQINMISETENVYKKIYR